jgi:ubiquinone/menaquinone biosynthesis C-methylase UbiE
LSIGGHLPIIGTVALVGDDLEALKRFRAGVFGRGAAAYDRVGEPVLAGLGRRLVELAQVKERDSLLDVAAGRGAVLLEAARVVGPGGHVVGVDLAREMVDLTAEEIRSRGLTNAEVKVADAERLDDFADGGFDVVTCAFSIFFFPGPNRALREFNRVLRPGGTVALSSWGDEDPSYQWYRELRKEFGVTVSLETQAFDERGELVQALEAAGFADVFVHSQEVIFRLAEPEEWWEWVMSMGGRASVEALDHSDRDRFRRSAFELIRKKYEGGVFELREEALLAVARKPAG